MTMNENETRTGSGGEALPLPYLPNPDPETSGFFEAARARRLVVKTCESCGQVLHLPRAYCSHCGSWETNWQDIDGSGHLYAWTVVERMVHPAYVPPYTVILVDLAAVPIRMVGNMPGRPALRVGQPMELWWWEPAAGLTLPNWRPLEPAGS
jgi:uncharacterized protein